jgi:hypothetical protein
MASKAFEKEFAKQRKAGAKEFSFGGKKFNTKIAKAPAKAAAPKKAKTPSSFTPGPSRAEAVKSMSKSRPSFSSLSDIGAVRKPAMSGTPTAKKAGGAFMKNASDLNSFKSSESRRSSDAQTGAAAKAGIKGKVVSGLKSAVNSVIPRKDRQFK